MINEIRTPLQVRYYRRCPEWDARSCPRIFDANGDLVCELVLQVGHPGLYDARADTLAHLIVDCVNNQALLPRHR